jgi:hypothetical protein
MLHKPLRLLRESGAAGPTERRKLRKIRRTALASRRKAARRLETVCVELDWRAAPAATIVLRADD